jgi:hypothetical protein
MEAETETNRKKAKRYEDIHPFQTYFREVSNTFNENINIQDSEVTHILNHLYWWIPITVITTSDLQLVPKKALNRVTEEDFEI